MIVRLPSWLHRARRLPLLAALLSVLLPLESSALIRQNPTAGSLFSSEWKTCRNDPVNNSDPLGLEAWGRWFENVSRNTSQETDAWTASVGSPIGAGALVFWSETSARVMGIIGGLDIDYTSKRLAEKLIKANEFQKADSNISNERAAYNAMQLTLNPMAPLAEAYDHTSYQPDDFGRRLSAGEVGERLSIGVSGTAGTVAYGAGASMGTLSSGRLLRNTLAARTERSLANGTLSELEVRRWYDPQAKAIDINLPSTEANARAVHAMRNALKQKGRDLMANRAEVARLDRNYPIQEFEYYANKYRADGFEGEALWRRIMEGGRRPNAKVSRRYGIGED